MGIRRLFNKKHDFHEVLKIDKELSKALQFALDEDMDLEKEGIPLSSTIKTFEIKFMDGKTAIIKVVSDVEFCHVEGFLIDENREVVDVEGVDGELLKRYKFKHNKLSYVVDLTE